MIVTGNQANNVTATNACTTPAHGSTHCYALTDRGTYDFLSAGGPRRRTQPGIEPPDRRARQQRLGPRRRERALNYFHVYIINPNKPNESVNVAARPGLLNFFTSPSFQS